MGLDFVTDINRDYAAAMNYGAIDRFIVKVLWWHFGFTVLMGVMNSYLRLSQYFPSPFSWRVLSGQEAGRDADRVHRGRLSDDRPQQAHQSLRLADHH